MIEIARTHKQYLFDCLFVDKQSAFNATGPFAQSGHTVRNKLCWDLTKELLPVQPDFPLFCKSHWVICVQA